MHHKPWSRHCWQLTTAAAYSEVWLIKRVGKAPQVTILHADTDHKANLMSYTNQVLLITSGMKQIFFSASVFFLTMWKYLEKSFHFLLIISLLQTFIDRVHT